MTQWQSIDSAPKTGRDLIAKPFLAYCPDEDECARVLIVWWEPLLNKGRGCWKDDRDAHEPRPTHWMPLPSAPGAQETPTPEPIQEAGPWRAFQQTDGKVYVESDDFEHDVRLYVDGDFRDRAQKYLYAKEIADRLNGVGRLSDMERKLQAAHKALEIVKMRVCGERVPNWQDEAHVIESRLMIANVCDLILSPTLTEEAAHVG